MSDAKKLTSRQERAVIAILENSTLAAASAAAGVGVSSMSVWINSDPLFKARLRDAHQARLQAVIARSAYQLGESFQTLIDLRDDKTVVNSTRLRAATSIISLHLKIREQGDILNRLEMIETVLNEYLLPRAA